MSHLDSELLLLSSEASPHIGLHLVRGCFLQQPHQQGIAGSPSKGVTELLEQGGQIIVDANHVLLSCGFLSEGRHYDDLEKPAAAWGIWRPITKQDSAAEQDRIISQHSLLTCTEAGITLVQKHHRAPV